MTSESVVRVTGRLRVTWPTYGDDATDTAADLISTPATGSASLGDSRPIRKTLNVIFKGNFPPKIVSFHTPSAQFWNIFL